MLWRIVRKRQDADAFTNMVPAMSFTLPCRLMAYATLHRWFEAIAGWVPVFSNHAHGCCCRTTDVMLVRRADRPADLSTAIRQGWLHSR